MKKIIILIITLFLIGTLTAVSIDKQKEKDDKEKLQKDKYDLDMLDVVCPVSNDVYANLEVVEIISLDGTGSKNIRGKLNGEDFEEVYITTIQRNYDDYDKATILTNFENDNLINCNDYKEKLKKDYKYEVLLE